MAAIHFASIFHKHNADDLLLIITCTDHRYDAAVISSIGRNRSLNGLWQKFIRSQLALFLYHFYCYTTCAQCVWSDCAMCMYYCTYQRDEFVELSKSINQICFRILSLGSSIHFYHMHTMHAHIHILINRYVQYISRDTNMNIEHSVMIPSVVLTI